MTASDLANTLTPVRIGASALLVAGLGHLLTILDVVGVAFFSASDPGLRSAMEETTFAFAELFGASSSVWTGYVGFSFSHGFGLTFVGLVLLTLAARAPDLFLQHNWLLTFSFAYSVLELAVALSFWFWVPIAVISVSTLSLGYALVQNQRARGNLRASADDRLSG